MSPSSRVPRVFPNVVLPLVASSIILLAGFAGWWIGQHHPPQASPLVRRVGSFAGAWITPEETGRCIASGGEVMMAIQQGDSWCLLQPFATPMLGR